MRRLLRQSLAVLRLNLFMALLWVLLSDTYTVAQLLTGFAAGFVVLAFFPGAAQPVERFRLRRLHRLTYLFLYFLKELVVANLQVAAQVIKPRLKIKPGVVAYPLRVRGNAQITILASMITLTPGTLSVDVSPDRRYLYVHCIDARDPDAALAPVRRFEDLIEEVTV